MSEPRDSRPAEITRLLHAWSDGDRDAFEPLMEQVYDELRSLARRRLQRERDASLQPTALVHELYLKLKDVDGVAWRDRGHFYAIASKIMRRLLVDDARRRRAGKRRGVHVELAEDAAVVRMPDVQLLALDEALTKLQERYPRQAQVVELRYFGGMTHEEVAEQIGMSVETAKLDWRFARSWLERELKGPPEPEAGG